MARKSAHMIRANKHRVVIQGVTYSVVSVVTDDNVIELTLRSPTGAVSTIRRSPGAKLEVI